MRILTFSILTLGAAAFAAPFTATSTDFKPNGTIGAEQVYNSFGCSGPNVSPEISWKNAPAGTKSFAVTVYDPDAPTGSGWWHWLIYDIAPTETGLPKDTGRTDGTKLPSGAKQARTDFGVPGYGGPCPPPGKPHRYIFTVFALKVEKLDVAADGTAAHFGFALNANALGKATLTGKYGIK